MFLLYDIVNFDAGHPDHVSIPTEKWEQIPLEIRKRIRAKERTKKGSLKPLYDQARQYADFAASNKKDPEKWSAIVAQVKASDKGGAPGQWSAVKASIATRKYKESGGGYTTKNKRPALKSWFAGNSLKTKRES